MKKMDLAVSLATTLAVFLCGAEPLLAADTGPPFPAALKAAAVHVAKLPNMASGLLVGNGEMNAVVFADGSNLPALSEYPYRLGREAGQAAEEGGDFLAQGVRKRKA